MKAILIITVVLSLGTISSAQTYESNFQIDRNGYGNLKSMNDFATIKLTENSIWIKFDKLNNPIEFYFYQKLKEDQYEDHMGSIYLFSDATIDNYGYCLLYVNKYFETQEKENITYTVTLKIMMIDMHTFNTTGNIEPTRYTTFYSTLKQ